MSVAENAPDDATATGRELLCDLVSTPSVTGDEAECARRLAAFFEARDRDVWIDAVGNVRAPADDSVLLTSHVDTVPGDVEVRIAPAESGEGEALWGRGSVDAKGSLAAMAVAAVETGVSFAGVVSEETDSRGARHLVADREEPDAVVNGEPSGWSAITLGYRGFLAGTYRVSTPAAHSSRPEPNALQAAVDWWDRVEAAFEGDPAAGSADGPDAGEGSVEGSDAEPGVFESVTAKPVSMEGGTAPDGRSTEATVEFQVRVPPGRAPADVREVVEAEARAGVGDDTVEWADDHEVPPWVASPRSGPAAAFRAAIRGAGGDPAMLRKTGTADANLYADGWDCPVVTYGPGDSALDHAPDEHLPLAEFDRAVVVLEAVADRLRS